MNSMTGFGQYSSHKHEVHMTIVARSYNARHLDVKLNVPEHLDGIRPAVEQSIRRHFRRGTIQLKILIHGQKGDGAGVSKKFATILEEFAKVKSQLAKSHKDEVIHLADYIRVLVLEKKSTPEENVLDADLEDVVQKGVEAALKELVGTRAAEGKGLQKLIDQLLGQMGTYVDTLQSSAKSIEAENRERLEANAKAFGIWETMETQRLQQELFFLLDRQSIGEELGRLRVHIDSVKELLKSKEPVGKKLEFYGQELLREVNTIGSKIQNGAATQIVVDFKAAIENFREQVQNVE